MTKISAIGSPTNSGVSKQQTSRVRLRAKATQSLHLTYSKKRGNLGLVLLRLNIACFSMLLL